MKKYLFIIAFTFVLSACSESNNQTSSSAVQPASDAQSNSTEQDSWDSQYNPPIRTCRYSREVREYNNSYHNISAAEPYSAYLKVEFISIDINHTLSSIGYAERDECSEEIAALNELDRKLSIAKKQLKFRMELEAELIKNIVEVGKIKILED